MIKTALLPAVATAMMLAGCMPAPQPAPTPVPAAPVPTTPPPVAGVSGLEEREPDLCGAKEYTQYLSQPGSVISTIGLTKEYRVVEHRGIEPQDYDPNRIVFRLDAAGNINNIDCG
ncbi:I78 family peptidase inhibitor [Paracoccus onubensis]|uniref:Peptidase inhibitor I78 family protein n=1 Tax=Paracoccus onubensis TaxID=1675788 RepID=A0A418SPL1_9RHOB|nr:I78 family peptidase inhibitor [Paracoccus onubensis]RJE82875.1 hypothetical protein D3P04_17675 [Paracoccus onubensis]